MNTFTAKKMMDAFYEAKRIRDHLPPLPDGIQSSYINTLDAVRTLSEKKEEVRVSDVADIQQLPRPTVTRTVRDMERRGLLRKKADAGDRRVILLEMTDSGRSLYRTYVRDYFNDLTQKLDGISDDEAEMMIETIHKVKEALQR